jgi:hypothetical protein
MPLWLQVLFGIITFVSNLFLWIWCWENRHQIGRLEDRLRTRLDDGVHFLENHYVKIEKKCGFGAPYTEITLVKEGYDSYGMYKRKEECLSDQEFEIMNLPKSKIKDLTKGKK